jgi:hypothetical protein
MMQHSENELATYVTASFASKIGQYLREILALLATKYFGYTRAQAYDPAFTLKDADFTNYDPAKVMTSVEMTEERPPVQWWPTETDLTAIRAIPYNEALVLAKRWPPTAVLSEMHFDVSAVAGAPPASSPGAGASFVTPPGQAP